MTARNPNTTRFGPALPPLSRAEGGGGLSAFTRSPPPPPLSDDDVDEFFVMARKIDDRIFDAMFFGGRWGLAIALPIGVVIGFLLGWWLT